MRVQTISFNGVEYPVALTLGVSLKAETEHGLTLSEVIDKVGEGSVDKTIWLFSAMASAAAEQDKYLRDNGLDPISPEPKEVDKAELLRLDAVEFSDLFTGLEKALVELLKRKVEAKPAKKAKAASQAG